MEMEMAMELDEERRRQRKLEEALEVKSLRRIISAYLNYPEAAEEDVKRYERCYRKLPPPHKALLSHYPSKFQKLRKCISMNSYFIFAMLQVFEPPLDMSQDMDICEDSHIEHARTANPLTEHGLIDSCWQVFEPPLDMSQDMDICEDSHIEHARNANPLTEGEYIACCNGVAKDGRMCCSESDQPCCEGESDVMCKSPKGMATNKEVKTGVPTESKAASSPTELENKEETDQSCGNDVTDSNRNVPSSPCDWLDPSFQLHVPLVDVDKVRCIIRNIVRDWASEGQKERDQCYRPILEELDAQFPNRSEERPPACLVPGAGLGRLALEISSLGFISQGNEFSYYMMICSSFILNHTQEAGQWTIYPWIHSNCNSLSDSDQLRPVSIPDIHPASAGITEGFSMCGGDFVEVYSDPSQGFYGACGFWDAVVTCFFIDTAHNIVEYIEIISRILKDGGVWINLGPLLYHFADMYGQEDEMSIELSLEDVKRVALHYGFELEKEKTIETTYTTNPRSMMQNHYYAAFWTMRKKSTKTTEETTS